MYVEIGRALRLAREQRGLSLEQVARRVSMSRQTVWYMEQGRAAAPLPKLAAVANAVGLKLQVVVAAEGSEPVEINQAWSDLSEEQRAAVKLFVQVLPHLQSDVVRGLVAMLGEWKVSHKD